MFLNPIVYILCSMS